MFFDSHAAYGATGAEKEMKGTVKKSPLPELILSLFVPFLIFLSIFWLRSFSSRYKSENLTDIMCYCFLIVPFAAWLKAFSQMRSGRDHKPMTLLAFMALIAWLSGVMLGDFNFNGNMKPFYDIRQLNVYPSVEPSKYGGQQLMDAGIIEFTAGTKLLLQKSMGFKDGDVYCVSPIVSGSGNQSTYDFWAVGVNCCSGHMPDFHCGEYSSPHSMKGLRLMDNAKREMYSLVVKKAEAEFGLKVSHPVFVYWLSDPEAEVSTYQDDGWQFFVTACFGFLCAQLLMVLCASAMFAKM